MFEYLIGVPFVSGGRDLKTGFDCYGLMKYIYKCNYIELDEYYISAFDCEKVNNKIKDNQKNGKWIKVDVSDLQFLDVLCIKFNSPIVNHVGVYIGDGKFIHTREKIGVNIDRINSPAWRHRIDSIYRRV